MSNTAEVSPYASEPAPPTQTERLRHALAQAQVQAEAALRAQRRQALVQGGAVKLLQLRSARCEDLVQSAQRLGYRVMSPAISAHVPVSLMHDSGRVLVLQAQGAGVQILGSDSAALGRVHTVERLNAHLDTLSEGAVQRGRTSAGELQLTAREARGGARLAVEVLVDGRLKVDIGCVRGTRCETILSELAHAVGGTTSQLRIKADYYNEAPAEPTRVRL